MRLLTIMLRYGTEAYPRAEAQLNELFERYLSGVKRDLIVVDNALPSRFVEETAGDRTLIGGDNRFREFSGFDRALRHVGRRLGRYDLVQFVTDAFHTLYVDYLDRFDTPLLTAIARQAGRRGSHRLLQRTHRDSRRSLAALDSQLLFLHGAGRCRRARQLCQHR